VRKASRLVDRHGAGRVVAVIEVVSPGNKDSRHALRSFVEKVIALLGRGVQLLHVDPFPPSPRDPQGLHKAIRDELQQEPFELPADRPLTLAAYSGGPTLAAFVQPVGVGEELPDMPLFLEPDAWLPVPLAATYSASWDAFPAVLKPLLTVSP
jgi:hypothetical protein